MACCFDPLRGVAEYTLNELKAAAAAACIDLCRPDTHKPKPKAWLYKELCEHHLLACQPSPTTSARCYYTDGRRASPCATNNSVCSSPATVCCYPQPLGCTPTPSLVNACAEPPIRFGFDSSSSPLMQAAPTTELMVDDVFTLTTPRGGIHSEKLKVLLQDAATIGFLEEVLDAVENVRAHYKTFTMAQCKDGSIKIVAPPEIWEAFWLGLSGAAFQAIWLLNVPDAVCFVHYIVESLRAKVFWLDKVRCCRRVSAVDVLEPQLTDFLCVLNEVRRLDSSPQDALALEACWRRSSHRFVKLHAYPARTAACMLKVHAKAHCGGVEVDPDSLHKAAVRHQTLKYTDHTVSLAGADACCEVTRKAAKPGADTPRQCVGTTVYLADQTDFDVIHKIGDVRGLRLASMPLLDSDFLAAVAASGFVDAEGSYWKDDVLPELQAQLQSATGGIP